MIVICTKCQAKFRVADEKIGPRGAKVRCSKCQTIFAVHPDLGSMPLATESAIAPPPSGAGGGVELEPRSPGHRRSAPPPVPPSAPTPARNVARAPHASSSSSLGAPEVAGPVVPPSLPPMPPPLDDPFAAAAAPRADAAPSADPFAFPPPASGTTLPVTDLSDLIGAGSGAPAWSVQAPFPRELSAPDPFDAGMLERPEEDEGLALEAPARSSPASDPPNPAWPPVEEDGGLALEDRLTPPPGQLHAPAEWDAGPEPAFELGAAAAFEAGAGADPFGAASFGARQLDTGSFELAGSAAAVDEPAAPPPDEPGVESPAPLALATPAAPPVRAAPQREERIPGQRGSRVRAVAANAVALIVLLFVAGCMLVVWRTDGQLEAGALHPSAILAALRRDPGSAGPFSAQEVRSGVYERERAAPLLFVRGKVVSRARAPVRAVKVAVEIVRAGQVLARGDALAGAVPTAEELYGAADAAALQVAAREAAARAPRDVNPGDALPFLVAIGDAPADLEGASVRVVLAPVERRSR